MWGPAARSRTLLLGALGAVVAAAACSGQGTGSGAPHRSTSPEPPPAPSASAAPPSRTPLVLAVHPSRSAVDVPTRIARQLLAGTVTDWTALGGPSGGLRVVAAPGTPTLARDQVSDAHAALAAVRRDPRVVAVVAASEVGPAVRVLRVGGRHPLTSPATYPLTVAGPAPRKVTTVTVVGDVMLARRVGERLAARGDFAAALRPSAARLRRADLTVGNLESTLARAGAPRQGTDSFGADPRVRAGLRLAGFDVLSLANNHVGDYGVASLVRTVRRVRAAGIVPVGAGRDLRAAQRPAVVDRGGLRFGIVAFDAIGETPAATARHAGVLRLRMQPRTGPLDQGDLARVTRTVRELRPRVDVLMVVPHWGTQYTTETVRDQRVVARALVAAGADVVVGGHPHWVQGVEIHRGALVAYSLGNFVFDMDFSRETREGAILELTFWDGHLKAAEVVPVVIGADFAPRVAPGLAGRRILDRMWRASGPPLTGTHVSRGT